ncbi:MAG: hypothetical protein QOI21_4509 [Actinomycetota bacterium]|jgi:transcriptional regulator with XRE-family HTH domain|nr:hypothetical protein [Actinomycetota bacterium]
MGDAAELGAFLKTRRAALDPAEMGVHPGLNQRRVAGLRREEIAQLAGISVDYYTRLEQGRAHNVSDTILDALARALRLQTDEETYLRNLAAPKRKRATKPKPLRVRPELQLLLNSIQAPAFIYGRYLDVLAWNELGGAISFDLAALTPAERNMARMFFLNDSAREMYPEWDIIAKDLVSNLRAETGRYPDDPQLAQLIGELSMHSAEFRKLWARHAVKEKAHCIKVVRNPIVGELLLRNETLRLPEDDLGLIIYTADPGSDSERALRLLASWIASPSPSLSSTEMDRA